MVNSDGRLLGNAATLIRVLIVDDHPIMRTGIASVLANQPGMDVVGEAADGGEALELASSLRPEIILMDLQMPGMDGIEAIRRIKHSDPKASILVLTTYPRQAQITRALEAGAKGCLIKSSLRTTLIDGIRAIHEGRPVLSREMAEMVEEDFQPLSSREVAILKLIAEGNTNREIGIQLRLSTDTIKAALKALFLKLDVDDRTHAVMMAARRGFIDTGQ